MGTFRAERMIVGKLKGREMDYSVTGRTPDWPSTRNPLSLGGQPSSTFQGGVSFDRYDEKNCTLCWSDMRPGPRDFVQSQYLLAPNDEFALVLPHISRIVDQVRQFETPTIMRTDLDKYEFHYDAPYPEYLTTQWYRDQWPGLSRTFALLFEKEINSIHVVVDERDISALLRLVQGLMLILPLSLRHQLTFATHTFSSDPRFARRINFSGLCPADVKVRWSDGKSTVENSSPPIARLVDALEETLWKEGIEGLLRTTRSQKYSDLHFQEPDTVSAVVHSLFPEIIRKRFFEMLHGGDFTTFDALELEYEWFRVEPRTREVLLPEDCALIATLATTLSLADGQTLSLQRLEPFLELAFQNPTGWWKSISELTQNVSSAAIADFVCRATGTDALRAKDPSDLLVLFEDLGKYWQHNVEPNKIVSDWIQVFSGIDWNLQYAFYVGWCTAVKGNGTERSIQRLLESFLYSLRHNHIPKGKEQEYLKELPRSASLGTTIEFLGHLVSKRPPFLTVDSLASELSELPEPSFVLNGQALLSTAAIDQVTKDISGWSSVSTSFLLANCGDRGTVRGVLNERRKTLSLSEVRQVLEKSFWSGNDIEKLIVEKHRDKVSNHELEGFWGIFVEQTFGASGLKSIVDALPHDRRRIQAIAEGLLEQWQGRPERFHLYYMWYLCARNEKGDFEFDNEFWRHRCKWYGDILSGDCGDLSHDEIANHHAVRQLAYKLGDSQNGLQPTIDTIVWHYQQSGIPTDRLCADVKSSLDIFIRTLDKKDRTNVANQLLVATPGTRVKRDDSFRRMIHHFALSLGGRTISNPWVEILGIYAAMDTLGDDRLWQLYQEMPEDQRLHLNSILVSVQAKLNMYSTHSARFVSEAGPDKRYVDIPGRQDEYIDEQKGLFWRKRSSSSPKKPRPRKNGRFALLVVLLFMGVSFVLVLFAPKYLGNSPNVYTNRGVPEPTTISQPTLQVVMAVSPVPVSSTNEFEYEPNTPISTPDQPDGSEPEPLMQVSDGTGEQGQTVGATARLGLAIWDAPSVESSRIGGISPGEKVTVVVSVDHPCDENSYWCVIRTGGEVTGYTQRGALELDISDTTTTQTPVASSSEVSESFAYTGTLIVIAEKANIYFTSQTRNVLAEVSEGEILQAETYEDGGYTVRFFQQSQIEQIGWIREADVSRADENPSRSP